MQDIDNCQDINDFLHLVAHVIFVDRVNRQGNRNFMLSRMDSSVYVLTSTNVAIVYATCVSRSLLDCYLFIGMVSSTTPYAVLQAQATFPTLCWKFFLLVLGYCALLSLYGCIYSNL